MSLLHQVMALVQQHAALSKQVQEAHIEAGKKLAEAQKAAQAQSVPSMPPPGDQEVGSLCIAKKFLHSIPIFSYEVRCDCSSCLQGSKLASFEGACVLRGHL